MIKPEQLEMNARIRLDSGYVIDCNQYVVDVIYYDDCYAKEMYTAVTVNGRTLEFPGSRVEMIELFNSDNIVGMSESDDYMVQ